MPCWIRAIPLNAPCENVSATPARLSTKRCANDSGSAEGGPSCKSCVTLPAGLFGREARMLNEKRDFGLELLSLLLPRVAGAEVDQLMSTAARAAASWRL